MRLPGLRSIHWKVFISHLLILILPCTYLVWTARDVVERAWLQSTEEGLIDVANITAAVYARAIATGVNHPLLIRYGLTSVIDGLRAGKTYQSRTFDLELIICDAQAEIVYDTLGRSGKMRTTDVMAALEGRYGSRWKKENGVVKLYSTIPVRVEGKIVGTVTAVKPTKQIVIFITDTLLKFAIPALLAFSLATILAYIISGYITGIVRQLATQAEAIAAGKSNVKLETWTRSELGMLARALEKMRARLEGKAYVEDMVTNLSHELKTPLAAIRGAAEILEDAGADQPAIHARFLSNIQNEVTRLDNIVSNVLALSRVESTRVEDHPIDIAAQTRQLVRSYELRAEASSLRFNWTVEPANIFLTIDEKQWELLCNNLVENAFRFSRPNGVVTLRLSCGPGSETPATTILLEVSDEGVGIEADLQPKIFDRFFTTPSVATGERGTGLGLAIVKSIVHNHGGEITAESTPNLGTTFRLVFR